MFIYSLIVLAFCSSLLAQEQKADTKTQQVEVEFLVNKDQKNAVPLADCWVWLPTGKRYKQNLDSVQFSWPVEPTKVIEKRGKKLIPRNLILRHDQPFIFYNSSKIGWNPKMPFGRNVFSMNIPSGETRVFKLKSTNLPLPLEDGIEDDVESSTVFVVDHPFVSFSDNGKTTIVLPHGKWFLRAWHEDRIYPEFVIINDGEKESWSKFKKRKINVTSDLKKIVFKWSSKPPKAIK